MRATMILALVSAAITPAAAQAQSCDSYIGQPVPLTSFDNVAEVLKKVPLSRGEYETSAQFAQRQARSTSSIPRTVIIPGIFEAKHVNYDADESALRVSAYALRNLNTDYSRVFGYGTPLDGKVEYGSYNNVDVVVFQSETSAGTYSASNAYGASVTVNKITRVQKAIFDRKADGHRDEPFVSQAQGSDALVGKIPMSVSAARSMKVSGKVAYVAAPKWPYFVTGTKTWNPTISRPTDVTNHIQVIVADLQCGLLLEGNNIVVAAFDMN